MDGMCRREALLCRFPDMLGGGSPEQVKKRLELKPNGNSLETEIGLEEDRRRAGFALVVDHDAHG